VRRASRFPQLPHRLFGLDKLANVERSVARLAEAFDRIA
jgi:hypothetical protein